MPPSMQKSDCSTSVRERILAFERGQNFSENSIIRARYVPDVRGVNRYKHFHVVNTTMKNPRQEKTIHKEAITDLPQLTQTTRNGSHHHFIVETDDNGVEKGKRNKKSILPQLGSPSTITKTTQKEKSIGDHSIQQAKSALTSSELQASSTVARSALYGRKVHDRLSSIHLQNPTTPRTFASFGTTKDTGDDNHQNDEITDNDIHVNNETSEEVTLPEKIQQSTGINTEPSEIVTQKEDDIQQSSTKSCIESATQTLEDSTIANIHLAPIYCFGEGRSTQTESYPIVVNRPQCTTNELMVNMEDVEEREALYQVIENALGETIDRCSRLRANQIIANSARKQGEIWRDVKDFIAKQLVPQSIHLANKSRSRDRTAVEIIASLRSFP